MIKNNDFEYKVKKGERVKIKISFTPASQSGSFAVLTLDGQTLNGSGSPTTYEFTVVKDVEHEHTVIMDFTFMPDAPDSAQYNVEVSGSNGGTFTFAITKLDPIQDPAVVFMVVAG
jgi:hypothetical protein